MTFVQLRLRIGLRWSDIGISTRNMVSPSIVIEFWKKKLLFEIHFIGQIPPSNAVVSKQEDISNDGSNAKIQEIVMV